MSMTLPLMKPTPKSSAEMQHSLHFLARARKNEMFARMESEGDVQTHTNIRV